MPDIFDRIHRYVEKTLGNGPVCVHLQDIRDCPVKQHPDYSTFRKSAVASGIKSSSGSRSHIWESMVALGRLCDMDNDDRWKMAVLDCLSPVLRARPWRISREYYADREEIQSDMVETAIATWVETERGFPPKAVRGAMVKSAFSTAYARAKVSMHETLKYDVESFRPPAAPSRASARDETPFIRVSDAQAPDMAAIIRGEQYGSWLYENNCMGRTMIFHDSVRSGRFSDGPLPAPGEDERSHGATPDRNHYYRVSDLLPSSIGIREAAAALGISEAAARRAIREGSFPCPVTTTGQAYNISVKAFMRGLNIPDSLIHPDDVENGAAHAARLLGGVDISEVPQGLDCPER
ncbi:hypothetical protein ABZW03_07975 [Kitasatospora sp. NPDC004799]|uniref:helix-turn-helix transcriptional regulator n=1 Tax=Kitasatospora sp. NPDC004799 TaxID=3154460 RepID=UPI0033AD567B